MVSRLNHALWEPALNAARAASRSRTQATMASDARASGSHWRRTDRLLDRRLVVYRCCVNARLRFHR